MTIAFDAFLAVDLRVGTILKATANRGARRPSWRLRVDFGPVIGVKTSSAQLVDLYRAEDLVGRQVVAVVNFAPRQVASVRSEVLVLGVPDSDGRVVLLAPERPVPNGGRVY